MKRIAYLGYGLIFLLASCSTDNPTKSLSYEEQLKKDIAEVDAYLAANSIKAIVDTTGVRYLVTKEGSGEKPAATSIVYVSGTVKVINTGVVFLDTKGAFQSFDLNEPTNPVSLRAVLPLVKKGSVVAIYSPSGLAYGATSSSDGKLTANSNVIFDLSILDEVEQFKADTIAIEAYLKKNSIKAVKDPTGLRYVISVPGTGPKPIASSTITFNYEGKLLATDVTFDKSTSAPLTIPLTSIIKGLQIGFPLISKGTKATFYIPSSLGYGPVSTSSIPGNSNLIFDIELLSIQ